MIQAGPRVKHGIKVGDHVLVDSMFTERKYQTIEGTDYFICRDKFVFAKVVDKKVFPLGRKILILRDTGEKVHNGIIACAEAQHGTDQSLDAKVVGFGILPRTLTKSKKPIRYRVNGIGIGDRVRLKAWSEAMIEFNIHDDFYLIVNEEDLLFKHE